MRDILTGLHCEKNIEVRPIGSPLQLVRNLLGFCGWVFSLPEQMQYVMSEEPNICKYLSGAFARYISIQSFKMYDLHT